MSLNSTLDRLEAVEASAAALGRDIGAALGTPQADPSLIGEYSAFYGGPEIVVGKTGWRLYYEDKRATLYQAIAIVKASGGAGGVFLLSLLLPAFGGSLVAFDAATQGDAEAYAARLRELYAKFDALGGKASGKAPEKLPEEQESTLGKLGAAVFKETKKEIESTQTTVRIVAFAAIGLAAVFALREIRR